MKKHIFLFFLIITMIFVGIHAYANNVKTGDLPSLNPALPTDQVVVTRGGVTGNVTANTIVPNGLSISPNALASVLYQTTSTGVGALGESQYGPNFVFRTSNTFIAAYMEDTISRQTYKDPAFYGVDCQGRHADENGGGFGKPTWLAGTTTFAVPGYIFNPAIAGPGHDGDVGSPACFWDAGLGATTEPPCTKSDGITANTWITAVDVVHNTASVNFTFGDNSADAFQRPHVTWGGYPTNSGNLSTASTDAPFINSALADAGLWGATVILPNLCVGSNIKLQNGAHLEGRNASHYEGFGSPYSETTLLKFSNEMSNDSQFGINLNGCSNCGVRNITVLGNVFPYPHFFAGMRGVGIGGGAGQLLTGTVVVDNDSLSYVPVGVGQPIGSSKSALFSATGTAGDNHITVLSVLPATTTTRAALALGNTLSGPGGIFTSGTTITAMPDGSGQTGLYQTSTVLLSNITSTQSLSVNPYGAVLSATVKDTAMVQVGFGVYGTFSDSTFENNFITAPTSGGYYFSNAVNISGNGSNWINGGRIEECAQYALNPWESALGAGIMFDGGGAMTVTGLQTQFCAGLAIHAFNTWAELNFAGDTYQGNGTLTNGGSNPNPLNIQVLLEGTGSGFSVVGSIIDKQNESGGTGTSNYFLQTGTGSTIDHVTLANNITFNAYNTALVNFTNETPTHYKIDTEGEKYINTLNSNFSVSATGNAAFAGTLLTGGFTVSTLPSGTVGMRAYVTDQLSACPAPGGALTGGGSVKCPVFFNSVSWVGD